MTERISPEEVRGLAYWLEVHGAHLGDEHPNSRYIYEAPFFAKAKRVCILADQMEAVELERDALTAKAQEYEARLKGRVWRPFDTAPQDETEILVYRPDAGVFTARYYPSLNEDDEWDMDNCCWFTMAGEDLTRDLPTHWMPLPDGPDQTINEEEKANG